MDSNCDMKKMRHKEVILLVDNRREKQVFSKANLIDFRSSAFKQTQVDPFQPRPDINCINEQELIISNLKRKVQQLQKRVVKLESQSTKEANNMRNSSAQNKKKRRKFSELARNFQCPHSECYKFYGSQTSLKNHLKLKHSSKKANQ